jgi:hypothetical protein
MLTAAEVGEEMSSQQHENIHVGNIGQKIKEV